MPTVPQTVIRLQLGVEANPPATPIDINTGASPQAWAGASLDVQLSIFGRGGAAVDLSNLDYLEVDIFPAAIFNKIPGSNFRYNPYSPAPYPNQPPAPLQFVTIPAADIEDKVGVEEWRLGNAQQAVASFSWVQMAGLELDGKPYGDFWLAVHGITAAGRKIVYGAAPFRVWDSGVQGIFLPNAVAPLLVPPDTIFYVEDNTQIPFSEPIDIEGEVIVDGGVLVQY